MLSWFKKKFGNGADENGFAPESIEIQQEEQLSSPESTQASPAPHEVLDRTAVSAVDAGEQVQEQEPVKKKKLFERLKERLGKTRQTFVRQVDELFLGKRVIDEELLDDLEEILIMADLGVGTTQDILEKARLQIKRKELNDPQALRKVIKEIMLDYLQGSDKPGDLVMPESGPFVIMVLGVNGVGKTTTIGKMAYKFKQANQNVLLVAADTFRAAASEQLQIWGERIGVEVISQQQGADPSSVVYDALEYAGPRNFDVIIVDTAGRLHTKVNLMEELKKIKRVMDKKLTGAPHEIMLVLDATTGQNAVSQAKLFHEAVGITGLTLTKLDGTAKGGIVINICHDFSIPIRFIGIGEQMEDLRDFDASEFVEALFNTGL